MFRSLHQLVASAAGLTLSLGIATSANASIFNVDMNNADLLGLINTVHLEMIDEVGDGCWTNIGEVRSQAQGILASAGISVGPVDQADTPLHPALIISARGQRVDGAYCIVQTEVRLSFVTASRFAAPAVGNNVVIVNYNSISTMFRANVAVVSNEQVNAEVSTWVGQVMAALTTEMIAKREQPGLAALREQLGLGN